MLRFDDPQLTGVEIPVVDVEGEAPGPHAAVIAGVHGCEYSSIAGARRFVRELDPGELRGRLTVAAIVNPASFWERTPFVSPADGKNLNRCFPVDLHGGDMVEALEPFSLFDASPVEERARTLAVAFGLPYVTRVERGTSPVGGTTSAAAADAGIPAVIAEVGGRGLLEPDAVDAHVVGIGNVLRTLGMLPGSPAGPSRPQHLVERFVWLRSTHAGWWQPVVRAGDLVAAGDPLGDVEDLFGDRLERIEAPEDGVVLFITSSPAMAADGLLLGLGAGLRPLA
jgi:predicted deacylase